MSPLIVRPAELHDLPAITEIYAHAVRYGTASFELDPPSRSEMTKRYQALMDSRHPYLVAQREDTVLGYAYAGPYRARPAYRWTVEDSVYIAPPAQGQGIGRALLDRLIVESQSRGFRQMIAVIGDSTQAASIAVHQAAGFRLVGTFENVGFKFGRWLDTVLMQRPLGAGASEPPKQ